MKINIYQVDAFTNKVFGGNPAAVCPLDSWPDDNLLQNIAAENNLAETAYIVPESEGYRLRWFTPKAEVDLCGHATIASAYVLFEILNYQKDAISFQSRSGLLTVRKDNDWFILDFPVDEVKQVEVLPQYTLCFNIQPIEAYRGKTDLMLVFDTAETIAHLQPNLSEISKIIGRGLIATAPGTDTDFVSRFFGPAVGINEDPVTGSAHTTLTPYWSKRLNKINLTARQLSERGGFIKCRLMNNRVEIGGQAAFYLSGEIWV